MAVTLVIEPGGTNQERVTVTGNPVQGARQALGSALLPYQPMLFVKDASAFNLNDPVVLAGGGNHDYAVVQARGLIAPIRSRIWLQKPPATPLSYN